MVAATVAAVTLTCRPEPGLGSVSYTRAGRRYVVDLATCRERVSRAPAASAPEGLRSPDGTKSALIVARRSGSRGTQAIVVRDNRTGARHRILVVPESYERIPAGAPGPLGVVDWSPDGRWVFFYIDPQGSQSLAADGLVLQAVSVESGRTRPVGMMLMNDDYRTWCGDTLVFTGGGDRLATNNKRLLVASAPDWKPRVLVPGAGRAWGSLTCAAGGRSVVVQSQPVSDDFAFAHTHWSLWRVGLDGSTRRLTSPPPHYADESPQLRGDTLYFVRAQNVRGVLYALRKGKLAGPLASLGLSIGYYGHRAWEYTVSR